MGNRLFHGSGVVGPFDYHEFTLKEPGDSTKLHAHERPHMVEANKPVGVYVLRDGAEIVERVEVFDMRLISAHRAHLVFAFEPDTRVRCLFSKYDEHGTYLAEAKMASTQPYEEDCAFDTLPKIVRDTLCANS